MWFAMGGCELNIPTQSVLNRFISFRIVDVYHPDPDRLLRELHGDDVLQGVVVDISRSAAPECDFAVVQLEGRTEPVIVPTNHVLEVL